MPSVQLAYPLPCLMLNGFIRKRIAASADKMAKAMAAERVTSEQDHVERQHNRADADPETVTKLRCRDRIVGEYDDKDQSYIKKIAMNVLQNKRKLFLAPIFMPRLADGTGRRVGPEVSVIRPVIVIARVTET